MWVAAKQIAEHTRSPCTVKEVVERHLRACSSADYTLIVALQAPSVQKLWSSNITFRTVAMLHINLESSTSKLMPAPHRKLPSSSGTGLNICAP